MREPTGLLEGRAFKLSALITRIESGSRSKISATTVETMVSWDWPDEEVPMSAVTAPERSTRTKHESIHVVVWFLGLKSGSKEEFPPEGSRQVETPTPAKIPFSLKRSRFLINSSNWASLSALSSTVS